MFQKLAPVCFLRCLRVDLLPFFSLVFLMGLELSYVLPFSVTITITIVTLLIFYLCHILLIFNNEHFLRTPQLIFCLQTPRSPNYAKY